MLASSRMVGFVPTKDSKKARAFYEGKLGFQFVSDDAFALVVKAGETTIRVAKAQNFTPAQYTVLGWAVDDIEKVVTWLRKQGVAFEKYPFIQDQELGIWTAPGGDKSHGSRTRTGTCSPSASMARVSHRKLALELGLERKNIS